MGRDKGGRVRNAEAYRGWRRVVVIAGAIPWADPAQPPGARASYSWTNELSDIVAILTGFAGNSSARRAIRRGF